MAVRLLGIAAVSGGAGYAGAELHRALNPVTVQDTQFAEIDLEARKILLDIGDRYMLTNERLNRFYVGTDTVLRNHERKIAELQEHTGINRPVPTPRPRPTASERLKPAPVATAKATPTIGGNP